MELLGFNRIVLMIYSGVSNDEDLLITPKVDNCRTEKKRKF